MNKALHVYIDESGTPGLADKEDFLLGAFLTEKPISQSIIDLAIRELKNDPDITEQDNDMLLRGFFHSSEDSKNAHSAICRQIKAITAPCEFFFEAFKKKSLSDKEIKSFESEAEMHQHLLSIVGVHFTHDQYDEIQFHIAQRSGSFKERHADKWHTGFIDAIAYSAINTPQIPIRVPQFSIEITDGTNPGVQIADFLLWAAQSKIYLNNETWVKRSGLLRFSAYYGEEFPLFGNEYFLNRNIPNEILMRPEEIPKPADLDPLWNENDIRKGMINIEVQLTRLANSPIDIKNEKIRGRIAQLMPSLSKVKIPFIHIVEMAKVYLLVVDQIPLYDKTQKEQIILAYHYKKICSKTANQHFISWFEFCRRWSIARQWIYDNDRNVLFPN